MPVGKQLFYRDKPVFGFDIGRSSIKILQIEHTKRSSSVIGYGTISFDPKAIENGAIVDPEVIIKAAHELIEKQLVGKITTKSVAVSMPNTYSFNRILLLPKMERKDLVSAVELEASQSIPLPLS